MRVFSILSVKERMLQIIGEQPEDSSYEEILRELAFDRMVERGLADSKADERSRMKKWVAVYVHGNLNLGG